MFLNIPVICGSIRQGRQSIHAAQYVAERMVIAGHSAPVIDFTELELPILDAKPEVYKGEYPDPEVKRWSSMIKNADALVIVSPEYNHGYPSVLKNALDWLTSEFTYKPLGLIGVSSGLVGGARVIEQLRELAGNFGMYDIKETVMFRNVQDVFTEQGQLLDLSYEKSVDGLVRALVKIAEIVQSLHKK